MNALHDIPPPLFIPMVEKMRHGSGVLVLAPNVSVSPLR
jgi:hypothetical protein